MSVNKLPERLVLTGLLGLQALAFPAQADYYGYPDPQGGAYLQPASFQYPLGPSQPLYQPQADNDYPQGQLLPPELEPWEPGTGSRTPPAYPAPAGNHPVPLMQSTPLYQPVYQPALQRNAPPGKTGLNPMRQQLVQAALRSMGVRYRWGGNSPKEGFACSGFTRYSFRNVNIQLPRTAAEQSRASRTIQRHDLKPGDMIFFRTSGHQVNHVGIYLGNGRFVHAASGGGRVLVDDLRKSYWQSRFHKYGTFFQPA